MNNINRPEGITDALAKARASEEAGNLLTPLKRFYFECGTNNISDQFELYVAFVNDDTKSSQEVYYLNGEEVVFFRSRDLLEEALSNAFTRVLAEYDRINGARDEATVYNISFEKLIHQHMVIIFDAESVVAKYLLYDDDFCSASTILSSLCGSIIRNFIYETFVLPRDNFELLEKLIPLILREEH